MRCVRAAAWLALASALGGCVFFRSAEAPMPVTWDEPGPAAESKGLTVLLPGIFDDPDDFIDEGIVSAVRAHEPTMAVASADAHIGYYKGKANTIVQRLRQDIVLPACRRGYRRIWFMGSSLGGFGALLYASRHPHEVSGVIAVAPFLGDDEIADEVNASGGLARWDPGDLSALPGEERFFREVWRWLQPARQADRPPIFLGFGSDDGFAFAGSLVAATLPRERVLVREGGGHDWATWRPIFATLLQRAKPLLAEGRHVRCP
jgi:pimeloyl-ACP methyl ester carboxylesterase